MSKLITNFGPAHINDLKVFITGMTLAFNKKAGNLVKKKKAQNILKSKENA